MITISLAPWIEPTTHNAHRNGFPSRLKAFYAQGKKVDTVAPYWQRRHGVHPVVGAVLALTSPSDNPKVAPA